MSDDEILFETRDAAGIVTLNRPKALNAVTRTMVGDLHAKLIEWANDDAVQTVVIKAAGENPSFVAFMKICDKVRTLGVRTNADTPADAKKAREFGAEGIGEMDYQPGNPRMTYGDAIEGTKSNAITRCGKELGIARDLWSRRYLAGLKRRVPVNHRVVGDWPAREPGADGSRQREGTRPPPPKATAATHRRRSRARKAFYPASSSRT